MKRLIRIPFMGLVLFAGLLLLLFGTNLHTWYRLTDESPIAELTFRKTAPHHYTATIAYGDFCTPETYQLFGDQWRLDAQFLKWRPWANLLGLDAMYRIERLGGRYKGVDDENSLHQVAYQLHSKDMPDLTVILGRYGSRFSPVDTLYGSSVYEVMDEQYIYQVYRSQSGLLVRKQQFISEAGALTIPIRTDCAGS